VLARFGAKNLVKEAADLVGHRCVFVRLLADHFHAAAVDLLGIHGRRQLDIVMGDALSHEFGFDLLRFGKAIERGNQNLGHDFTFLICSDAAVAGVRTGSGRRMGTDGWARRASRWFRADSLPDASSGAAPARRVSTAG